MKKTAGNIAQMAGGGRLGSDTNGSGLNKIIEQVTCDIKYYIKEMNLLIFDDEISNKKCLNMNDLIQWVENGLL